MQASDTETQSSSTAEKKEVAKMSDARFYRNALQMAIMWTAVCFSTYLLHFQLKYLRGDIFANNNYSAISDFIAVLSCGVIYNKFGLKATYHAAFVSGLIGALGILYLEQTYGTPSTGSASLTAAELQYRQNMFYSYMPWLCFVAKFGIAMAFLNSYYASFTEENIFPIERRATAIGICNFCARGLTGLAPMVNEMADPIPIVSIICILFIGFINNFILDT